MQLKEKLSLLSGDGTPNGSKYDGFQQKRYSANISSLSNKPLQPPVELQTPAAFSQRKIIQQTILPSAALSGQTRNTQPADAIRARRLKFILKQLGDAQSAHLPYNVA
jgi:hypothetical protein